jgi:hypothetical protein
MTGSIRNGLWMVGAAAFTFAAILLGSELFAYVMGRALNATEVLTLGQLIVLTFGLGSVVMLWAQSRDESKWRRLLSYHQYFSDCPVAQARTNMLEVLKELGHEDHLDGKGTPLHTGDVDTIFQDRASRQKVLVYLDGFEQMCGAINSEIVDEDYAYDQEAGRVLRIYDIFKPLIDRLRADSPKAYEQFEILAELWKEKKKDEATDARKKAKRTRAPG